MPTIQIVAFRGTGGLVNADHKYHREPAMVRAGHIAVGGVVPGKLVGFSPTRDALTKAGDEEKLLKQLIEARIPQDGNLKDDTFIFERAHAIADGDPKAGTEVWQLAQEVNQEIVQKVQNWYNNEIEASYALPFKGSENFPPNTFNCLTFLFDVIGINPIVRTGYMSIFMPEFKKMKGAILWPTQKPSS